MVETSASAEERQKAMSRFDKYVIESRDEHGVLKLDGPQPESFFGKKAISGITEDEMAKVIFHYQPNAVLSGMNIPEWPTQLNPAFRARRKTW